MAGEAVVEVEEDGVVEVAIDGLTVDAGLDGAVETKKKPDATATAKPADDAKSALTEAVSNAEAARKAAEATATAERRNADEARQALARSTEEANRLRETAEDQKLTIITNELAAATREAETATAEIERAAEAGDFKAQAAAQLKQSRAAAKMDRLEADKAAYESGAKKIVTHEGRVENPAQQQPVFDRYLAGFTPRAQAWLRLHPDCAPSQVGGDSTKNAKMMAGHYEALAKGHAEGSDSYFQTIEEVVGIRQPVSAAAEVTAAGDPPAARKPAAQQRPQPAAPPSRDGSEVGTTGTTRSVRLNPAQQEAALFSYPQNQGETEAAWKRRALGTYAAEFVKAQAEGKIGRMTH